MGFKNQKKHATRRMEKQQEIMESDDEEKTLEGIRR